jgi:14-3-3 protein epsilon
VKAE